MAHPPSAPECPSAPGAPCAPGAPGTPQDAVPPAPTFARDGAPARQRLLNAAALVLIILVAIAGYRLSPTSASQGEITLSPEPGCNLHRGPCDVAWGGGRIALSITPRPVPLISPIRIEVRTSGFRPASIEADIAGIGMDMGLNRPTLQPEGDGLHAAGTTLPVCITGVMAWELTLLIDTETGRLRIPFRFSTPEGS